MWIDKAEDAIISCSFCDKGQDSVAKLISTPTEHPRTFICDECVAVCNSILEDDQEKSPNNLTEDQEKSK